MDWKKLMRPTLLKVLVTLGLFYVLTSMEVYFDKSNFLDTDFVTRGVPLAFERSRLCYNETKGCYFFYWYYLVFDLVFWYFMSCIIFYRSRITLQRHKRVLKTKI